MNENALCWYSKLKNIEEMAKAKGYAVKEGAPVLSLELSEVFASTKIDQAMHLDIPDLECLMLGELWQYQISDILELLRTRGVDKDETWFRNFNSELSQAVYDEDDNLQALLLCSGNSDGIVVQLLLALSGGTKPIMSAMQGFLNAAWDWDEGKDRIFMVMVNDAVRPLMDKLLNKRTHIKELGKVHYIEEAADEEFLAACAEAAQGTPIQGNISWKMALQGNS